jgi:hypothetical protein
MLSIGVRTESLHRKDRHPARAATLHFVHANTAQSSPPTHSI